MCEPTTIALVASAALSAGGAAYSVNQQKRASKAAIESQQKIAANELAANQEVAKVADTKAATVFKGADSSAPADSANRFSLMRDNLWSGLKSGTGPAQASTGTTPTLGI